MANPSPPKLSQSLVDRANALTTKANEAQTIFGPITTLLDSYLSSNEVLSSSARSRKLLTALCLDFKATTERYFDVLIAGHYPPRPNTTITTPTVMPTATPLASSRTNSLTGEPTPKPSYAQKAQNTPDTPNPTPQKTSTGPTNMKPLASPTDNHLFVKIDHSHPARKAGTFVILIALKKVLGPAASLLKEVQEVKTGFALCTNSPTNLAALKTKETIIVTVIGSCKIETQEKWATYRLNYIPRNVTSASKQMQLY
ncbi:hypothetical protein SS1G_11400 [Sclerotinia sclerotiorum 1980 UF-70]|uniref:Uncharacterized protein n=2 Tax=Sclerotinia sclerotiorum (strain ATCC 18683 / 1980 / Ss-1) TaxID=665079 RepID=A7F1D0_SCLS1|nr:hypothetical protein SS1G_11400 [Sclerotinia sclerotiorum 1980 UF-70]APA11190.1 hypothetical protein sscle_07g059600 [Sclerotinia sclerotiorum 1980 UF-70]EDN95522.1 hypothetical protein SS1G_11400 [Sclerotinia sclerotiorum 1980 UF-70]